MDINHVKISANGYTVDGETFVPMADGNSDYQAILAWIAAGNTPEPHQEPTPVLVASAYQIRQALSQLGLRQAVETVIAAGDQELQDAWGHYTQFSRNHPKIEMMATALSLTAEQVDALFGLAVTLAP